MSKIAIDFGTTRTKVAYFDDRLKKPQVLELGKEIRSVIPSLFYIPSKGEILVGDDAVDEVKRDRRGVVRGLKMEIDKRTPVRKNKRKVDRVELAAVLFCTIKQKCETLSFYNEDISECILTIPPSFSVSPNKINAIKESAELGGFDKIETIEEPIAAARHWLTYGNSTSNFVFVCDIGGGTTDLALLKKVPESEDFQLYSELPPVSIDAGGNNIDNGIFEQLDPQGVDSQERDEILLRIKKDKEYVSRFPDKECKIEYLDHLAGDGRDIILGECADFIDIIKSDIERFIKKANEIKEIDLQEIPLLLVGGGMSIHGLKDSLSEIWPGTVILWTESEHATVLGALVDGSVDIKQEEAERYFREASNLWSKTLRNSNKLTDVTTSNCRIDDVLEICEKSLQAVKRYPMAFNLKNILVREKNLLETIDKAKRSWEKKEFETVIELCGTAIKFYPKGDLPLPAEEYYDDELITNVLLIQAEAYNATGKYKEAIHVIKECASRKNDLKSAYLLKVIVFLKGVKAKQFADSQANWQKIVKIIDYALALEDDNWGLDQYDSSKTSLLKYKAYALFQQNLFGECQEILQDILRDIDETSTDTYCLFNTILSYVCLKNRDFESCSNTLEKFYFKNDLTVKFLTNTDAEFFKWAKEEMSLTVSWRRILRFTLCEQFHDTCLRWWMNCNNLKSNKNIEKLYQLNSKQKKYPWRFRNGDLLQHEVHFMLKMAHVLADRDEKDQLVNCLSELWTVFPETPLSSVINDGLLKAQIIKIFPPDVTVYYDYGILDNWIRIYNSSPYTLHDLTITVLVTYKDEEPRWQFTKKLPIIESKEMFPPNSAGNLDKYKDWLIDVFPGAGLTGRKFLSFWNSNIKSVDISVTCRESVQLSCHVKKHLQRGKP